jgi:6-phosphogluconate dehydrogenase (decarboxylating)
MSDGPKASSDVNYLFLLAERELSASFHAVDQLFGAEQARRSVLDWNYEMEVMSWPDGEAIPNWRQATIRASARLCCSHASTLRQRATKIDGWREHSMNTEVGMIGLGRMGANMVRRLIRKGHQCVVFNRSPKPIQELVREGAAGAGFLSDLVKQLSRPRAISMMVPAARVHLERPGENRSTPTAEQGYLRCGPNGAGHFVKMVHNGIEYGVMAAYAEGLAVLRSANVGLKQNVADAETTPLRDPEHYRYDLDLRDIAEVWRRGSVISSWLLDLTAEALARDSDLAQFAGRVSDSGEGRWTIKAAIDEGVPVPVLSSSLYARFASRGESDFQNKVLSAMRYAFGGHQEKSAIAR